MKKLIRHILREEVLGLSRREEKIIKRLKSKGYDRDTPSIKILKYVLHLGLDLDEAARIASLFIKNSECIDHELDRTPVEFGGDVMIKLAISSVFSDHEMQDVDERWGIYYFTDIGSNDDYAMAEKDDAIKLAIQSAADMAKDDPHHSLGKVIGEFLDTKQGRYLHFIDGEMDYSDYTREEWGEFRKALRRGDIFWTKTDKEIGEFMIDEHGMEFHIAYADGIIHKTNYGGKEYWYWQVEM